MKRFYCGSLMVLFIFTGCEEEEEPQTPPPDDYTMVNCADQSITLDSLSSVGEHTGKSALDLLSSIGLNRTYTAHYATENRVVVQSPLGGETELNLSFGLENASVKEFFPPDGVVCPSRLKIDLNINVETSDGAFSETWPALLVYEPANQYLRLEATYDPENLNGNFKITDIMEMYNDYTISGTLTEDYEIGYSTIGKISITARGTEQVDHSYGSSTEVGISSGQRALTWRSEPAD